MRDEFASGEKAISHHGEKTSKRINNVAKLGRPAEGRAARSTMATFRAPPSPAARDSSPTVGDW